MTLPSPPIDQGPGRVRLPYAAGDTFQPSMFSASRIGSGPASPMTNPNGSVTPSALQNYNATSYGPLVFAGPYSAMYETGGPGPQGSDTTDYNTNANQETTYTGLQYKLSVTFDPPWLGTASVTISWRELTTIHAGTETATVSPNGTVTYSYTESASQSYAARSETITPNVGDTTAETAIYTIEGTSLGLGATVTIIGSNSVADNLSPQFLVAYYTQAAAKTGFIPYVSPETAPGQLNTPQTVYTLETASTAPNAPANSPVYSGSQDLSNPYATNYTYSANVPLAYMSTPLSFAGGPGGGGETMTEQLADQTADALGNIRQAVAATATTAQWPGELLMTLSNELTTTSMQAPADAALAAQVLPSTGLTVDEAAAATAVPSSGAALVALYNLPASEMSYAIGKSAYVATPGPYNAFNPGVPSYFNGQPAPLINSIDLNLSWTREVIDLDTGLRTSTAATGVCSFVGAPISDGGSGLSLYSAVVTEQVPDSNQRIEVSALSITQTTIDCLGGYPSAVVTS